MSSSGSAHDVLDTGASQVAQSAQANGRALLTAAEWQRVGQHLRLSPRELELVQQIFEGKKLLAIARDMHLALGTVKTYSQRIHRKLQVSDQRALTLAVVSAHLQLAQATR